MVPQPALERPQLRRGEVDRNAPFSIMGTEQQQMACARDGHVHDSNLLGRQVVPVVAELWVLTVHPASPWHGYRDLDGISITVIVATCPGPDSVVLRPLHPSL